ncbi:MAG: lipoyl(octanoyl) transferase LipB [Candidatus Symbiothrix sp.]|jgi:lipoyl(octanoyl) transferase|nr:lipoyl(octanoyl) transferase LipB [Candidatus Symbiothrix sp.]
MTAFTFTDWGLIPYSEAYEKQKDLFQIAIQQKTEQKETQNTLVFCEHPHVITIGKNGLYSNLLFSEKTLQDKQVELYHVNRGGDITYHGPGQLVGYPIFDLDSFHIGLKEYIYRIEEAIIRLLAGYDISGKRLPGATGVWMDTDNAGKTRKICAIGVKSSRYITMHGFALNISTDLSFFGLINPCGFIDKGVTSMEKELGYRPDMENLKAKLHTCFVDIFKA